MKTRLDIIMPLIKGKDVLDLGCVNMDLKTYDFSNSMHAKIRERCKYLLGIDFLKSDVDWLREHGYNVICQNVERLNLKRKFDIVLAGEIIEHLSNPGMFLESLKKCLKSDGTFILTTPNSLSLERSAKFFLSGKMVLDRNAGHTVYFTIETLAELLRRHGFKIEKFYYAHHEVYDSEARGSTKPRVAKTVHVIKSAVKSLRPHFKDTMVVICKLA